MGLLGSPLPLGAPYAIDDLGPVDGGDEPSPSPGFGWVLPLGSPYPIDNLGPVDAEPPATSHGYGWVLPLGSPYPIDNLGPVDDGEPPSDVLSYNVYASPSAGEPIDYSTPVATVTGLTWTSSALAYPGSYRFGVRAFRGDLEEKNLDASVLVILDASGLDVTRRPRPPSALNVQAVSGGKLRVTWAPSPATGNPPTGYHVYVGLAGSPLSYATPATTVSAFPIPRVGVYVSLLTGLSSNTAYVVGVRAFNATAEEPNTVIASAVVGPPPPSPPSSLVISTDPADW